MREITLTGDLQLAIGAQSEQRITPDADRTVTLPPESAPWTTTIRHAGLAHVLTIQRRAGTTVGALVSGGILVCTWNGTDLTASSSAVPGTQAAHATDQAAHAAAKTFEMSLPWIGATVKDIAGSASGGITPLGASCILRTGTTANSKASIIHAAGAQPSLYSTVNSSNQTSGDVLIVFKLLISIDAATANGVARLIMGKRDTDTAGPLGKRGYGLEIRNRRLWAIAWDTALREQDLGFDLVSSQTILFSMRRTATAFESWINGIQAATLNCGPIGNLDAYASFRAETQNNADAAEHRVNFSSIWYRIEA